jgi:hypothetical protein
MLPVVQFIRGFIILSLDDFRGMMIVEFCPYLERCVIVITLIFMHKIKTYALHPFHTW